MNRLRDMAIQNYTRRLTAAILDLVQSDAGPFDPPTPKTLPQNQTWSQYDEPIAEIWAYRLDFEINYTNN